MKYIIAKVERGGCGGAPAPPRNFSFSIILFYFCISCLHKFLILVPPNYFSASAYTIEILVYTDLLGQIDGEERDPPPVLAVAPPHVGESPVLPGAPLPLLTAEVAVAEP